MYRDNTLMPKEAVRLAVLGLLASGGPRRYGDLANEVRHFTTRIIGPSLDLMGSSLEMLRYEGLIEAIDGAGMEDNAVLGITDAGRADFRRLMSANVRVPSLDQLNKLVLTLKVQYLHLLDADAQRDQLDALISLFETESLRLEDLAEAHADDAGYLAAWLDHDRRQIHETLAWFGGLLTRLDDPEVARAATAA